MQKRDLIWQGLLVPLFTYIIINTLGPLISSLQNSLTIPGIPIDILPVFGIGSIIGLSVIGVLLILQLKSYLVNKSLDIVVKEKTSDEKLDDLIKEIDLFREKWTEKYRNAIRLEAMWGKRLKIRQHAREISKKTNSLRNKTKGVDTDIFNLLDNNHERMIELGMELEDIFRNTENIKQALVSDPNKMQELILQGDSISQDFRSAILRLENSRKYLS